MIEIDGDDMIVEDTAGYDYNRSLEQYAPVQQDDIVDPDDAEGAGGDGQ